MDIRRYAYGRTYLLLTVLCTRKSLESDMDPGILQGCSRIQRPRVAQLRSKNGSGTLTRIVTRDMVDDVDVVEEQ